MWRQVVFLLVVVSMFALSGKAHDNEPVWDPPARQVARRPVVQIALLLDTSNSMDGLIHQAQTQLWKIVNEMARLPARTDRSRGWLSRCMSMGTAGCR